MTALQFFTSKITELTYELEALYLILQNEYDDRVWTNLTALYSHVLHTRTRLEAITKELSQ